MLKTLKKIWDLYRPLHSVIWVLLVLMVLNNALEVSWPYIYGKAINAVVDGAGFVAIMQLLGIALAVLVVQNIVGYIWSAYEINKFDYAGSSLSQKLTFRKLFSLSIGQHRNEHSGLTQSVVSDGQSAMKDLLNLFIYSVLPVMTRMGFALIALSLISWKLGILVAAGIAVSFFISYRQNKHFTPFVKEERDMNQELGKKRSEMIRNSPLIISNSSEEYASTFLEEETEKRDNFGKAFWRKFIAISFLVRGMTDDITLVLSIGFSALFMYQGDFGAGEVVTVILWTSTALSNMGFLGNLQRQLLFLSERLRKYFKILELTSDVKLPSNPKWPNEFRGEVAFKDVSFVYPKQRIIEDEKELENLKTGKKKGKKAEEKPDSENSGKHEALEGVSFAISAGEHVAFVGASGAGKSTTILLLLRGSDPQNGSIMVDGIDLKEIDLGAYRSRLGVVEQNIVLFDDTIRRNISFGLPKGELLSDEALDRLAKIARIDEFKEKLVDGWDTVIGENGIKLSGGQRQRVGIARALAKDPSILILDEATSSLDAKNEALIKDALHDASKGRTTIMIAHRLSTVKDADRIFVFEKGKIVGVGKHEELLKTCSTYADLVSHQTVLL